MAAHTGQHISSAGIKVWLEWHFTQLFSEVYDQRVCHDRSIQPALQVSLISH